VTAATYVVLEMSVTGKLFDWGIFGTPGILHFFLLIIIPAFFYYSSSSLLLMLSL
jgi:hypothetical protein